jgi:hypothetical protein
VTGRPAGPRLPDAEEVLARVRAELTDLLERARAAGYVVPTGWVTALNDHLEDLDELLLDPPGAGVAPGSSAEVYP